MPKYRVLHKNQFKFEKIAKDCQLQTRLCVLDSAYQKVLFKQVLLSTSKYSQTKSIDHFGNQQIEYDINCDLKGLTLTTIHTVITSAHPAIDYSQSLLYCEKNIQNMIEQNQALKYYLKESAFTQYNDSIKQYAEQSFKNNGNILESCLDLNSRIYNDFKFDPSISTVYSTALDCFENQAGVCQDFSHFAIACLRSVGLIARYISGYVDTKPDPSINYVPSKDVSHAWFALYDPHHGWVEFDPTNNCLATDRYVRLAFGNDYEDICPLQGNVNTQGGHTLKVNVDVSKVNEN